MRWIFANVSYGLRIPNVSGSIKRLIGKCRTASISSYTYLYEFLIPFDQSSKYRFTSTILRDCLKSKYNINSPKTYDYTFKFPFETIPEEFLGSFIRGLWDGDGSFESHDFVFNPTCSINSSIFAKQVGEIIKAHTGLDYKIYTIQGKTCIYNTLRLHANRINKKEKVQKLYNFLYDRATIFLQRKKDKVLRYLEYRANSDVNKSEQCNA